MRKARMNCLVCGVEMYKQEMKNPLCSRECRDKNKIRECEKCGKEFKAFKSIPKRFCSPECAYKSRKKRNPKTYNDPCGYCGKGTGKRCRKGKNNVFCSQECNLLYRYPPRSKLCAECFGEKGNCKCVKLRGTELGKMIGRERCKSRARFEAHYQRSIDQWTRKIDAVLNSIRQRRKPNKSNANKPTKCTNWEERIDLSRKNTSARWGRQVRKEQDPWWIKVQTVESNWRKKANAAKGNKQSVV